MPWEEPTKRCGQAYTPAQASASPSLPECWGGSMELTSRHNMHAPGIQSLMYSRLSSLTFRSMFANPARRSVDSRSGSACAPETQQA